MSRKTWQNCRCRSCNWLVQANCMLTRVYGLTIEYYGPRINLYIERVKHFHITCQMVPSTVKIKIQETSKPLSVIHTSDLENLFSLVDLSPTVWWWDCFALLSPAGNLGSRRCLGWTSVMIFIGRKVKLSFGGSVYPNLPLAIMH